MTIRINPIASMTAMPTETTRMIPHFDTVPAVSRSTCPARMCRSGSAMEMMKPRAKSRTCQQQEVVGLGERPPHRLSDQVDAQIDGVEKNGKPGCYAESAEQKTGKLQVGQRRQGDMQQQDDSDDRKDRMQHFPDF